MCEDDFYEYYSLCDEYKEVLEWEFGALSEQDCIKKKTALEKKENFVLWLKEATDHVGVTKADLINGIGISKSTVARYFDDLDIFIPEGKKLSALGVFLGTETALEPFDFSDLLYAQLEEFGVRQEDVAAAVGVPTKKITNYCMCKKRAPRELQFRIMGYFRSLAYIDGSVPKANHRAFAGTYSAFLERVGRSRKLGLLMLDYRTYPRELQKKLERRIMELLEEADRAECEFFSELYENELKQEEYGDFKPKKAIGEELKAEFEALPTELQREVVGNFLAFSSTDSSWHSETKKLTDKYRQLPREERERICSLLRAAEPPSFLADYEVELFCEVTECHRLALVAGAFPKLLSEVKQTDNSDKGERSRLLDALERKYYARAVSGDLTREVMTAGELRYKLTLTPEEWYLRALFRVYAYRGGNVKALFSEASVMEQGACEGERAHEN